MARNGFTAILCRMCGICGILKPDQAPVEAALLKRLTTALAHRGPDGEGFFLEDPGLGFGFRRLAIIDLQTGQQPILNEDRQVVTVFNGEIYNYQALREELSQAGHIFTTQTDTEVLVHGYEAWGLGLVERLRGMYAFALWNRAQRRLSLVRDRTGQKPLYYARWGPDFVFASEIKALLQHPAAVRQMDESALHQYLLLGYVLPPLTLFHGIYKLGPGQLLTLEAGQEPQLSTYWQPTFARQDRYSFAENAQRLEGLLTQVVQDHLMSDVPLGTFLSGGLDSTLVTALAGRLTGQSVRSFTVGFDFEKNSPGDQKFNVDIHYARVAAQALAAHHREIVLPHGDYLAAILPQIVYALDEPIANPAIIQTVFVAALARASGVPVLLSGDGADETFAGYPFFQQDARVEHYRKLIPSGLNRGVLHALAGGKSNLVRATHKLAEKAALLRPIDRFLGWDALLPPSALVAVLGATHLPESLQQTLSAMNSTLESLDTPHMGDRLGYAKLRYWLAEDSNLRYDKLAMAMSIEGRAPFQDHELIDLALAMPLAHKLPRGGKAVLKQAARYHVPSAILKRKKWGFTPPASDWLRTVFLPQVNQLLTPERFNALGLQGALAHQQTRDHLERRVYGLQRVWSWFVLQMWHAIFIEQSYPVESAGSPEALVTMVTAPHPDA
ncbi:MAG: asparagine synthase (glutamine-hydrolyzing) [Anaerolineae bacterium]|nr:asparagine synthase (glutamine-hydrolyzing) [Anaerolineae bacterium]